MNQVIINGNPYFFDEGQPIPELLNAVGIEVPSPCHDERLLPQSVCRTCMVKVNNYDHRMPSGRTLLTIGTQIESHLPEIEDYHKGILQLPANNYPLAKTTY